jgi:hypothetical protein
MGSSIDFGSPAKAALPLGGKAREAPQVPPHPRRSETDVDRDVHPHVRASATFRDQSGSSKEWRGWYTDDDIEDSLERKARNSLGIVGSWRRVSFWSDHEGVRLVMTSLRKEVELRCLLQGETGVREIMIGFNESPTSLLVRIGKEDNYHILDASGQEFQVTDNPFAYATTRGTQLVRIVHGLHICTGKKRVISTLKDDREKIEVRFGDEKLEFEKGPDKSK